MYSTAALDQLKSSLDDQARSVPDSVTGWHVDENTNRVVVSVLDNTGARWAKSFGRGVRVERVRTAPRPLWNVIGGQAIYFSGGGRCSIGFNARNAAGTRYLITAGHCTEVVTNVSGTGGSVGPVAGSSFPGNDFGIIRVSSSAVSTPLVDRYSSGSDVTVAGSTPVPVGGRICRSGSTTGWRCGKVLGVNQTVNYGGGDVVTGLTRTNACAEPGDSGGSFVSDPGSGDRVQAQGLTSGGSGNCTSGGIVYFQPIAEALSTYGLTLYTG
ncbi:S1 family peptidase [Actinokineospora sp. NBRC 105648]|uniref:S1 family peptidase n=1 Tax=Actinokineospora sp. NBRC 105648 TaxID=3032206 RepID=UPI0025522895|nr:S1 family peptidase [Actinokineospora sp. NBRC 105648]